ncbi:MAG TPA: formate dehydrogenase accessory sulfurtransferase FdhD [Methylomirabilota bacterium]|jgi:FdhD protein
MDRDPAFEITRGATAVPHVVLKVRGAEAVESPDQIAAEEPLEIRLGGMPFTVTMRTPGHDEDLVAGLLYSEGLIHDADTLDVIARYRGPDDETDPGNVVNVILKGDVDAARARLRRSLVASSACGVCGKVTIDSIRVAYSPVVSDLAVPAELFPRLADSMAAAQATFERTGGLHAAGLFDGYGRLVVLREDIGRHNAVDKVIGHMLRTRRLPLDRHVLLVSGRASFEIMQKAWAARVPIVAAVSAPSSLAVEMAVAGDITLVGFLRRDGFNVYAGARRVTRAVAELV